MKILQSRSFHIGAALIVVGLAACVYFLITDQNDPDYAPPRFVVASMVGAWVVVAGIATVLFSLISSFLGSTAVRCAGLCIGVLGIFKLFAIDLDSLEIWRISRTGTITFDLIAVTAILLGGALVAMPGRSREPTAELGTAPNP